MTCTVSHFRLENRTVQTNSHIVAWQGLLNSDLSNSDILYMDLDFRIMKENIIQAVVTAMQRDLDCRQIARLKAVLIAELQDVEVTEHKETEQQR